MNEQDYKVALQKVTEDVQAACPYSIRVTWDGGILMPARKSHTLSLTRRATTLSFAVDHKWIADREHPEYGHMIARIAEAATSLFGNE